MSTQFFLTAIRKYNEEDTRQDVNTPFLEYALLTKHSYGGAFEDDKNGRDKSIRYKNFENALKGFKKSYPENALLKYNDDLHTQEDAVKLVE